jgi:hypothetical protein
MKVSRRMAPLYDMLKGEGFDIRNPYKEIGGHIRLRLNFNTTIFISETAPDGHDGVFDVWMERNNMGLMFRYFLQERLNWKMLGKFSDRWVSTRGEGIHAAHGFCSFAKRHLKEKHDQLVSSMVTLYLCLIHGTYVPRDIVRMIARFYYNNQRDEAIQELNTLPQHVLVVPQNY